MSNNSKLHKAKKEKNDEFYTQLEDIERELVHYKEHFKGKTVFCNCDDPEWSNFWKYFELNFEQLGIKKLISTHFEKEKPSYKLEIIGDINNDGKINHLDIVKTPLKQNGDFRSPECIEILKEADIIVTNPPFSLFREYVAQLFEYNKKFIIIGDKNAITYKEIFSYIKDNKLWLGYSMHSGEMPFRVSFDFYEANKKTCKLGKDGNYYKGMGVRWWTNLDHNLRHEKLILFQKYTPEKYPKYDNYDAINIDKVVNIPIDYDGVMGVPITFLDKYNPEQFEIVGDSRYHDNQNFADDINIINGNGLYRRILIKRK